MSNIYIERNPDGEYEVKESGNPKPVVITKTQKEAEEKVKQLYTSARPDVERVRHTDKGHPDHWRSK